MSPKLAFTESTLPLTVKEVKVPTLVMFGWLAVVTVPAVVAVSVVAAYAAFETVPKTLLAFIFARLLPSPIKKLA